MEFYKSRNLNKRTTKKSSSKTGSKPVRSFRNSRDDRSSRHSRDHNRNEQSTTVICSDCGITCNVPFVPRNNKPIYCNDCFKQNRFDDPDDSYHSHDNNSSGHRDHNHSQSTTVTCSDCGITCNVPFVPRSNKPIYCNDCFKQNRFDDSNDSYHLRDNNSSRYSRKNESSRGNQKSKKSTDKFLRKQEIFFSNGSDKFYKTIREKLFEILGGKICSNCGFRDERALKISSIYGDTLDDDNKRGAFASSLGKYISDHKTARNELKVLCLNCNQIREPLSKPHKGRTKPKKTKYFPR